MTRGTEVCCCASTADKPGFVLLITETNLMLPVFAVFLTNWSPFLPWLLRRVSCPWFRRAQFSGPTRLANGSPQRLLMSCSKQFSAPPKAAYYRSSRFLAKMVIWCRFSPAFVELKKRRRNAFRRSCRNWRSLQSSKRRCTSRMPFRRRNSTCTSRRTKKPSNGFRTNSTTSFPQRILAGASMFPSSAPSTPSFIRSSTPGTAELS